MRCTATPVSAASSVRSSKAPSLHRLQSLSLSPPPCTCSAADLSCAEVIVSKYQQRKYDGKAADVWSCGVILYLMLVGQYPFEDPADPTNFSKTIQVVGLESRCALECTKSDWYCREVELRVYSALIENGLATVQRIMVAEYEVPADVRVSPDCQNVLSRMLMGPPQRRISIDGIKA